MSSGDCEIWSATHATANCNALSPKDRVDDRVPLGLVAVAGFERCLPNVEVTSLDDSISARVVAGDANVIDVIALTEVIERLDPGWTVVGDDLGEGAPAPDK